MDTTKFKGPWYSGKLNTDSDPFEHPFAEGDKVLVRECDEAWVVVKQEPQAAIRFVTKFQVSSSCGTLKPLADEAHFAKIFSLVQEEARDKAGSQDEVRVFGEVSIPVGIPHIIGNAKVHVGSMISLLDDPVFFADWWFDRGGNPHMIWEKQVLYAALALPDQDFINKTNRHEPFERKLAVKYMTQAYGRVKPEEIETLAKQFGGVAHGVTIRVVEGFQSEALYDKMLKAWVKKAKLPIQPSPNEL